MSGMDRSDENLSPDFIDIFLEYSPDMAFYITPENIVRRATREGVRLLGYGERVEVEGKPILSLIGDPVLLLFIKRWFDRLNRGEEIEEEFPIELPARPGFSWLLVRGKNLEHRGTLHGKYFSISDITDHHDHHKILTSIMASIPGEILVFDRGYRVLTLSDGIARANGFTFWQDAAGHSVKELKTVDFPALERLVDRIILNDAPIHEVARHHEPSGTTRWYLQDLRVIASSAGTFGYIFTRFDVTGEIRPKAILEALMDSASDSISITDPAGNLEYASRSLAEHLGYQNWRHAVNRPWRNLFAYSEHLADQYAELFNYDKDSPRSGTLSVETPEGKRFYNYRVDPLSHEGEPLGWLVISSDTTELVGARNRAESAVRSKAAFLANMSHELRTPMNAVLGMNELLSRTELSPIQKNYATQMRSSATLLLSIINDILDFSRIEDRKMELSPSAYRTSELLRDVTNLIAVRIAEKELSFTVDVDPDVPDKLAGDAVRVKQILINLLNNAVKFTRRGSVSLIVKADRVSSDRVAVAFTVKDTGIGIPRHKQSELFERFSRIAHAGSASIEGTGLGLSICKGLVTLMDGTLSLESEEGKGSSFTAQITQGIPPDSGRFAQYPAVAGKALLAFDPDPAVRDSLSAMARHAGISARFCSVAADFSEALGERDFAWTHVVLSWRSAARECAAAVSRFPGVRWLALLSLNDFIGEGKPAGVDFVFKPLFVDTFADFLASRPVDFSKTLPLSSTLGVDGHWFRASDARILVVDDNTVNLKVIRGFLESFDITVDEAESGEAAVAMAGRERYDLVFMDHIMPGMDGIETTGRIRALPGRDLVPIVALTANTGAANRELYQRAGMNDTLFKPVDFNELVTCLRKWLSPEKVMTEQENARPVLVRAPIEGGGDWVIGLDLEAGIGYTGSRKNLETVLRVFNRTAPRMLEQLEAGRHSGDQAKFRIAVHSLKSSCANIGAGGLSAHAAALEEAILSGNAEAVDTLFATVHGELSAVIGNVADWFARKAEGNGGGN